MLREIVGYHRDETGAWVAELRCGHGQHLRHDPPWQSRPWVLSERGRAERLGSELDCVYCEMAPLPPGLEAYEQTNVYDQTSVPTGLLSDHRTKPGVWARIVIEQGKLEYSCARGRFVLRPGVDGVVEPDSPHHVRPLGPVRFRLEFLRALSGSGP
jgi:tellurite resistance-related uncharacterized protein